MICLLDNNSKYLEWFVDSEGDIQTKTIKDQKLSNFQITVVEIFAHAFGSQKIRSFQFFAWAVTFSLKTVKITK